MRRPTDTRIEATVTKQERRKVKEMAEGFGLNISNYLRHLLGLAPREHRGFQQGNQHAKKGRKK